MGVCWARLFRFQSPEKARKWFIDTEDWVFQSTTHLAKDSQRKADQTVALVKTSNAGPFVVRFGVTGDDISKEEKMIGKKLYVGGLPYSVSDEELEELFAEHGTVESARVIMDKMTGRSRGFGFVEMSSPAEAQAACDQMNGAQLQGRTLVVNEARQREDRGPGGGGGRRGGGGGRGGDRW